MKVFKFGGASLKSAEGIQNVARIVSETHHPLLLVVSAMGKTTDQLERVLQQVKQSTDVDEAIQETRTYHRKIVESLFANPEPALLQVETRLAELKEALLTKGEPDLVYDQVVSMGEIISSTIVHYYLISKGVPSFWLDARTCIATDSTWREGKVNWEQTQQNITRIRETLNDKVIITQGFIGAAPQGLTTTLGREGSDFSAAIFASCLNAESVTIWKDVPGVMNADPKRLKAAVVFKELPYKEAAEMTYYGASVIHPKTIKPLANRKIPLLVKNFDNPSLPGTRIHECVIQDLPPLIVFKDNQCLISCKVTDYTFISEQQLLTIFHTLAELDIRVNVMQNSAISFSFCIDFRESKLQPLIRRLQEHFEVYYNTGLTLITIKNYDEETFDAYRGKSGVLLEQSSRSTLQILVRP